MTVEILGPALPLIPSSRWNGHGSTGRTTSLLFLTRMLCRNRSLPVYQAARKQGRRREASLLFASFPQKGACGGGGAEWGESYETRVTTWTVTNRWPGPCATTF